MVGGLETNLKCTKGQGLPKMVPVDIRGGPNIQNCKALMILWEEDGGSSRLCGVFTYLKLANQPT
jgi:hypothetical protein